MYCYRVYLSSCPYTSTGTAASSQFKLVIIGPPGGGKTTLVHRLIKSSKQIAKGRTKAHFCKITSTNPHRWREMSLQSQVTALSQQYKKAKLPLPADEDLNPNEPSTSFIAAKHSHISVVMYDIAGDDHNCELLPLLLNAQDIVLLVYNASEVLANKSFETLEYFLQMICSHCCTEYCSEDPNPIHWPRIVIVGTHKDLLSSKSESTIISLFNCYSIGKSFVKHLVQPLLFVNCLTGKLKHIQDTILSVAKPLYEKLFTLSYFKFEHDILVRCQNQKLVLLSKEMIANQSDISDLEPLLQYCSNKGIILYYPKFPLMQDDILISPFTIINTISTTFGNHSCLPVDERATVVPLLSMFRLISCLPTDIMINDIAAFTKVFFHFNNTLLILPSHLKTYTAADIDIDEVNLEIIYVFPDGYIPKIVFHQLLTFVIDLCGHRLKSLNILE